MVFVELAVISIRQLLSYANRQPNQKEGAIAVQLDASLFAVNP